MDRAFYADEFTQVKIQLQAGEILGPVATNTYIKDDTGRPGYIRVKQLDGPRVIDVMMTEAVAEEDKPHTLFSGFVNIDPGMIGKSFGLAGFVADLIGNQASLESLQFTILLRGGKPTIVIETGAGAGKVAVIATTQSTARVAIVVGNVAVQAASSGRPQIVGTPTNKINVSTKASAVLRINPERLGVTIKP